ncbi:aldose epimerase [Paenibacillus selenitireducens]|uniref:Aldose epimerase n=1 Tax=Paenibacillus selenitireducens TaxID=1324314 RepID=A0A1T2X0K9_9BACL|nr:aldose 1-epimerase [Paenibacillus selenitireducens]OPA73428.1 aldose epimerase [Paenibacillus selenitireducens]
MTNFKAFEGEFQGEKAIWLQAGQYEAALLPKIGGNLIAFRDTVNNYRILREPTMEEMGSFKASPTIHGIPVLFPPNRYEDGRMPWKGRTLQFPVNEPATGNHLHGFVHSIPWQVDEYGTTQHESFVIVSVTVDEQHPVFEFLPFRFTLRLKYSLSQDGLVQHVTVRNNGEEIMPCLLAFHTAINAPFVQGSSPQDYRVKLTLGKRWELNERMLPTGQFQPLTANEEKLQGEGIYPFYEALDNHYTIQTQNGSNRMELTDTKADVKLVYDAGTSYKQWMIWNNGATEGFFCPEPQVNLVNAPNVDLPSEEMGLFALAPHELWEETSRIYVVSK